MNTKAFETQPSYTSMSRGRVKIPKFRAQRGVKYVKSSAAKPLPRKSHS